MQTFALRNPSAAGCALLAVAATLRFLPPHKTRDRALTVEEMLRVAPEVRAAPGHYLLVPQLRLHHLVQTVVLRARNGTGAPRQGVAAEFERLGCALEYGRQRSVLAEDSRCLSLLSNSCARIDAACMYLWESHLHVDEHTAGQIAARVSPAEDWPILVEQASIAHWWLHGAMTEIVVQLAGVLAAAATPLERLVAFAMRLCYRSNVLGVFDSCVHGIGHGTARSVAMTPQQANVTLASVLASSAPLPPRQLALFVNGFLMEAYLFGQTESLEYCNMPGLPMAARASCWLTRVVSPAYVHHFSIATTQAPGAQLPHAAPPALRAYVDGCQTIVHVYRRGVSEGRLWPEPTAAEEEECPGNAVCVLLARCCQGYASHPLREYLSCLAGAKDVLSYELFIFQARMFFRGHGVLRNETRAEFDRHVTSGTALRGCLGLVGGSSMDWTGGFIAVYLSHDPRLEAPLRKGKSCAGMWVRDEQRRV